jgi:hypothetical protein
MERAENDFHQALQDLAAVGGLIQVEHNDNMDDTDDYETMIATASHMNDGRQQQHIHTLRRLLRRLDRSLLRLLELVTDNDEKHNNSEQPPFSLSSNMCVDLLTILTRLRMPAAVDEASSTLEIAMSINRTVGRLWTMQECCRSRQDPNDMRRLLRRIVQHASSSSSSSCGLDAQQQQHQVHNFSSSSSRTLFLLCAPWLKVVNCQWMDQRAAAAAAADVTGGYSAHNGTTDPAHAVLKLQQILGHALESFQINPQWDINFIQDESREAFLLWRNLTGNLIEEVVELYQQQQQHHQQTYEQGGQQQQPMEHWLEDCFATINPQNLQKRQNGVSHAKLLANQMIRNLQAYAEELVDFALDALDGAAAVVADAPARARFQQHGSIRDSSTSGHSVGFVADDETPAPPAKLMIFAIRDSMRHVVVAVHVLQALQAPRLSLSLGHETVGSTILP